MNSLLLGLISFGDSTIAVGALLAGTGFLAVTRNVKSAAILFLAVVAAGAVIGTLKTVFIGCDLYISALDIRFPSGHAALSSAGLGTVCVLVVRPLTGWARWAVIAGFALVEAAIATILVVMGFHTFYEVIAGLIVGGGAVAGAYGAVRITMPEPIKLKGFVLSLATVVVAIHVAEVPQRDMASIMAIALHDQTAVCRPADHLESHFSGKLSPQAQALARAALETEVADASFYDNPAYDSEAGSSD